MCWSLCEEPLTVSDVCRSFHCWVSVDKLRHLTVASSSSSSSSLSLNKCKPWMKCAVLKWIRTDVSLLSLVDTCKHAVTSSAQSVNIDSDACTTDVWDMTSQLSTETAKRFSNQLTRPPCTWLYDADFFRLKSDVSSARSQRIGCHTKQNNIN